MTNTNFDVVINGTKARILRGEEGGYRRRTVRKEVQNNLLSQAQDAGLVSREDGVQLYQSSWAGGARWWKPLLSGDITSYFRANHMNLWDEPGKVVPDNQVTDGAATSLHDDCVVVSTPTDVYAIGSTNTTNASFFDVYKWTPASAAFVRETTYHSGIPIADQPLSAVYDSEDGYIYVLCYDAQPGFQISRFNPVTPSTDSNWLTSTAEQARYGAFILSARPGIVLSVGGSVYLLDKAGPTITAIFDGGMIESLPLPSGTTKFRTEEMGLSSPEGIFYVRNTVVGGQHQPWTWQLDRDEAGNWIGLPLAPLPIGSVALSVAHHMGSIVVATSPEPQTIVDQTEHSEIVLYHYTDGQPGALGSLLGRDQVDETPYGMLGSRGPLLYIGGHKRLWIYDAVAGGLHSAWAWGTENTLGPYRAMAWVRDDDDEGAVIFLGPDRIARQKRSLEDDPDTVASFGDDETYYTLESNYFDGKLPMEEKEITRVEILRDPGDGQQEWTVQLSADDGAFADALVHSTSGDGHASAVVTGVTGRLFRYKLIYQTQDTMRSALRALLVTMSSGEQVTEWDLVLDGSALVNMDNERQDPEAFADSLTTLANTNTSVTYIDNFRDQEQTVASNSAGVKVKVVGVEEMKDKPGEAVIRVVLREV